MDFCQNLGRGQKQNRRLEKKTRNGLGEYRSEMEDTESNLKLAGREMEIYEDNRLRRGSSRFVNC
jgi:hypothetical protein